MIFSSPGQTAKWLFVVHIIVCYRPSCIIINIFSFFSAITLIKYFIYKASMKRKEVINTFANPTARGRTKFFFLFSLFCKLIVVQLTWFWSLRPKLLNLWVQDMRFWCMRVWSSGPIGRKFINSFKIFFSGIWHLAGKLNVHCIFETSKKSSIQILIEFQNPLIMGFSLIKGEISDVVNVRWPINTGLCIEN